MDEWRENDNKIKEMADKLDHILSFLKGEFGDADLSNNIIEGRTKKEIRELKERVAIQNGRVFKLEKWQWMTIGGGCVVTVLITILGIIPLWFAKH